MAAVAVMIVAAMIRIVAGKTMPRWMCCELCGESAMYFVESGEALCGGCLVERRSAWRAQNRPVEVAKARAQAASEYHAKRARDEMRRDFEGDVEVLDLIRDGYYDEFYGEWSASETVGPKPRWIEETTLADEVSVSQGSLLRAIFALIVAAYGTPVLGRLRRSALRNAKLQLDEALVVAKGYRDVVEMYDGVDDRDLGDDVMGWLHRDGQMSQKRILDRWNRPSDEQDFLDEIRASGRESEWWELMVDFRRRKLDALLKEYFGLDDYRASMIVLKWERTGDAASGRWKPAKQMNVVEWVKWSCEQSGSILGGLQSCTRSIQVKTQLRDRKAASKVKA
jgi:hypothetical protein